MIKKLNELKKALLKGIKENQKGLSLIEILIALTLMATAGTFMIGKFLDNQYEGNVRSTEVLMNNLKGALLQYKRHCFAYPTTDQGLEALLSKPTTGKPCKKYNPSGYLEGDVPMDPWGNPFIYESDGRTFNIISFGQDGAEGGEEKDKDIYLNKPKGDDQ